MDAIKSCRLVLQRAPMGSISVNTTFHLEPPAWQACLRICFGFGVYDYGNKSLVHSGSKLKRFYTHLKAWCFYWKHKRLSQGSCSLWHHPKQCLVAKSWNEVRTAPTVPDKDSFIKPMLPGCVLNTASKRACWRIRYFFSGLQTLNQKLIQAVIPGFSFSTLTVYPVTVGNCDTDRALCQGVSRCGSTSVLSIKRLEEWDKVMSIPSSRWIVSRWEHSSLQTGGSDRDQGRSCYLWLFLLVSAGLLLEVIRKSKTEWSEF